MPKASSCMLVLPSTMAPAPSSFLTTGALRLGRKSFSAGVPAVLAKPLTWMLSFTTSGTPCSGPLNLFLAAAASASRAALRAASRSKETKELRSRFFSIASASALTRSSLFSLPSRISAAASLAESSTASACACAGAASPRIDFIISFQELGGDQLRQDERNLGPDDDRRQHEEHRHQHDQRVLQREFERHLGHRARDHEA